MLVAKTYKIADRIDSGRSDRLVDKDASDILRLMQSGPPEAAASTLRTLLADPVSAASARFAVERFRGLFGNRAGVGIEMASRALRGAMPDGRVRAICMAYTEALYRGLEPEGHTAASR